MTPPQSEIANRQSEIDNILCSVCWQSNASRLCTFILPSGSLTHAPICPSDACTFGFYAMLFKAHELEPPPGITAPIGS